VLSLARAHKHAAALLDAWIFAAVTSGLEPLVRVAITIDRHAKSICNAVILGVNNTRLEAMNSTVRLLSHRARGFQRLESLLSLITLYAGEYPYIYSLECPKRGFSGPSHSSGDRDFLAVTE
jgi:transposase